VTNCCSKKYASIFSFGNLQEMIHLPIVRHVRRLLASAVIFGTAVLLMLWLPVRILRVMWPSFLPYTVALQSEAQVNELSLELLLLQASVTKEYFHSVQNFFDTFNICNCCASCVTVIVSFELCSLSS